MELRTDISSRTSSVACAFSGRRLEEHPITTVALVTSPQNGSSPTNTTSTIRISRKGPNYDFYNECWAFPPLIYSFFAVIMSILVIVTVLPVPPLSYISALTGAASPLLLIIYMYFLVLTAIIMSTRDSVRPQQRPILASLADGFNIRYRTAWQLVALYFYVIFLGGGCILTGVYYLSSSTVGNIGVLSSSPVLYVMVAIMDERRLWRVSANSGTP
ncbi:hypothetical protein FB567DRAFT_173104 [Paraphoma chrysanthemicola]|uniref:Uncharacterized protein n=1 Tax=Paraphoma chrysanthemicola TaxID=798071 RepID=A0A8K0RF32_9PLEO|nr:hypothetical protein FB567DRAFT_173104 [Paraphoma chrysanthemicola]